MPGRGMRGNRSSPRAAWVCWWIKAKLYVEVVYAGKRSEQNLPTTSTGSLTPSRENRAFRTGRRLPSGSRVTRGLVSSMEWEGAGEARRGVSWWGGHTRGHTPSTRACGVGTGPDRPLSRKGLPLKENECPSVSPKQPPPPPTEHPAGSLRGRTFCPGRGRGALDHPDPQDSKHNQQQTRPVPADTVIGLLGFQSEQGGGAGSADARPGVVGAGGRRETPARTSRAEGGVVGPEGLRGRPWPVTVTRRMGTWALGRLWPETSRAPLGPCHKPPPQSSALARGPRLTATLDGGHWHQVAGALAAEPGGAGLCGRQHRVCVAGALGPLPPRPSHRADASASGC